MGVSCRRRRDRGGMGALRPAGVPSHRGDHRDPRVLCHPGGSHRSVAGGPTNTSVLSGARRSAGRGRDLERRTRRRCNVAREPPHAEDYVLSAIWYMILTLTPLLVLL